MSNSINDLSTKVTVWVPTEITGTQRDALPSFRGGRETVLKPVKVEGARIANSLRDILRSLAPVVESAPIGKGLVMDELELSLTISADGEVGFIASVSAGMETSIKLRLKRQ